MSQQIGSYGFKLSIPVEALATDPNLVLRVDIQRPDNTEFSKLSANDDVEVNVDHTIVSIRIAAGDFTIRGIYHYQIFDLTNGGNVKSSVGAFYTEANFIPQ